MWLIKKNIAKHEPKKQNHMVIQDRNKGVWRRGAKTPRKLFAPLDKCVGHNLKNLGPPQKTLRSAWCPKLVTCLWYSHFTWTKSCSIFSALTWTKSHSMFWAVAYGGHCYWMRSLWRHSATLNSRFQSNVLAKFVDTVHIIMGSGTFFKVGGHKSKLKINYSKVCGLNWQLWRHRRWNMTSLHIHHMKV